MKKLLLAAAAFAALTSGAQAAPMNCHRGDDTVTVDSERDWSVTHFLNGKIYERADQYALRRELMDDGWSGYSVRHPDTNMVGEYDGDGHYSERIFKAGNLVATLTYECDVLPPVQTKVETPAPVAEPVPQPATKQVAAPATFSKYAVLPTVSDDTPKAPEKKAEAKKDHVDSGAAVLALTLLFMALGFYFLPSIAAWQRGHRSSGGVFILNLLLGWTFLFWVIALAWAFSSDTESNRLTDLEYLRRGNNA